MILDRREMKLFYLSIFYSENKFHKFRQILSDFFLFIRIRNLEIL